MMPKYTVYGSDVTFYMAEVEANSIEEIYEMDEEDINWVENDGEAIQINEIKLDGKRVDQNMHTYQCLAAFNVVCYMAREIQATSPEEAKAKLYELGQNDELWSNWDVDYASAYQHRIVSLQDESENMLLEDILYESPGWEALKTP